MTNMSDSDDPEFGEVVTDRIQEMPVLGTNMSDSDDPEK
jgi:hypothetical protein